jgi:NTE family protein
MTDAGEAQQRGQYPRRGLVLGAGGVTGHGFHAGVLCAVHEATGWDPRTAEVIVGTSAGAEVAALLRAGVSAADLAARAKGEPLSPQGEALLAAVGPPLPIPPLKPAFIGHPVAPDALRRVVRQPLRAPCWHDAGGGDAQWCDLYRAAGRAPSPAVQ